MTPNVSLRNDPTDESEYLRESLRRGYDIRIVPYEEIHSIRNEDFGALVRAVDAQDGDWILDAGSGYGAVTREILLRNPGKTLRFCNLDLCSVQIERGIKELSDRFGASFVRSAICFKQDSILHPVGCDDSAFDKVVAKMVIHEIPRAYQAPAIQGLYRLLKPGGKLVVWDLMLDEDTQGFFQEVIKKKDKLAGFDSLARYRYFLREQEWVELLKEAGFQQIKKEADVYYELHTDKRLFRELGGDLQKLEKWHAFIREQAKLIPGRVLEKLRYADFGHDITFVPPKAIYSAVKV